MALGIAFPRKSAVAETNLPAVAIGQLDGMEMKLLDKDSWAVTGTRTSSEDKGALIQHGKVQVRVSELKVFSELLEQGYPQIAYLSDDNTESWILGFSLGKDFDWGSFFRLALTFRTADGEERQMKLKNVEVKRFGSKLNIEGEMEKDGALSGKIFISISRPDQDRKGNVKKLEAEVMLSLKAEKSIKVKELTWSAEAQSNNKVFMEENGAVQEISDDPVGMDQVEKLVFKNQEKGEGLRLPDLSISFEKPTGFLDINTQIIPARGAVSSFFTVREINFVPGGNFSTKFKVTLTPNEEAPDVRKELRELGGRPEMRMPVPLTLGAGKTYAIMFDEKGRSQQSEIPAGQFPKDVPMIQPGEVGTIDLENKTNGLIGFDLNLCSALLVLTPKALYFGHSDFWDLAPLEKILDSVPDPKEDSAAFLGWGTDYQGISDEFKRTMTSQRAHLLETLERKEIPSFFSIPQENQTARIVADPNQRIIYVTLRAKSRTEMRLGEVPFEAESVSIWGNKAYVFKGLSAEDAPEILTSYIGRKKKVLMDVQYEPDFRIAFAPVRMGTSHEVLAKKAKMKVWNHAYDSIVMDFDKQNVIIVPNRDISVLIEKKREQAILTARLARDILRGMGEDPDKWELTLADGIVIFGESNPSKLTLSYVAGLDRVLRDKATAIEEAMREAQVRSETAQKEAVEKTEEAEATRLEMRGREGKVFGYDPAKQEEMKTYINGLDQKLGEWSLELSQAKMNDLRARVGQALKEYGGVFAGIDEVALNLIHGTLNQEMFFEMIRRLGTEKSKVLAALIEYRRDKLFNRSDLSEEGRKVIKDYETGKGGLTPISLRDLVLGLPAHTDKEYIFLSKIILNLSRANVSKRSEFIGSIKKVMGEISEVSQWDLAHRFRSPDGKFPTSMMLARGFPSNEQEKYIAGKTYHKYGDVFFTHVFSYAEDFTYGDGMVAIVEVSIQEVGHTSWTLFPQGEGGYEPEIMARGSFTVVQVFKIQDAARSPEWEKFAASAEAALKVLPNLDPRDLQRMKAPEKEVPPQRSEVKVVGGLVRVEAVDVLKTIVQKGVPALEKELQEDGRVESRNIGEKFDESMRKLDEVLEGKNAEEVSTYISSQEFMDFMMSEFREQLKPFFGDESGAKVEQVVENIRDFFKIAPETGDRVGTKDFADTSLALQKDGEKGVREVLARVKAENESLLIKVQEAKAPEHAIGVMTNHAGADSEAVLKMLELLTLERLIVLYKKGQPMGRAFSIPNVPLVTLAFDPNNPNRTAEEQARKALVADHGNIVALWTDDLRINKMGVYTIIAQIGQLSDPELKALACAAVQYIFLKYATATPEERSDMMTKPELIRTDLNRMGFGSVIQVKGNVLIFDMQALADSFAARASFEQAA